MKRWLVSAMLWPATAAAAARPPVAGQLVQVLGGLGLVLGLVLTLAWLLRRLDRTRLAGGRGVRLVAGLTVGAKERILVVEVGETQLVVGVAPGRVQTLHVLEQPLAVPTESAAQSRFGQALAAAVKGSKP